MEPTQISLENHVIGAVDGLDSGILGLNRF